MYICTYEYMYIRIYDDDGDDDDGDDDDDDDRSIQSNAAPNRMATYHLRPSLGLRICSVILYIWMALSCFRLFHCVLAILLFRICQ